MMNSEFHGPMNIGSAQMISINQLANMIAEIAGKKIAIKNVPGPLGVRGRTSDNALISEKLAWAPSRPLQDGLSKTYAWIEDQLKRS